MVVKRRPHNAEVHGSRSSRVPLSLPVLVAVAPYAKFNSAFLDWAGDHLSKFSYFPRVATASAAEERLGQAYKGTRLFLVFNGGSKGLVTVCGHTWAMCSFQAVTKIHLGLFLRAVPH